MFLARDPFDPVVPEPAPDPATDGGTVDGDPDSDPSDPSDPGSAPGSPTDLGTTPGSPTQPGPGTPGAPSPGDPGAPGSPPSGGCSNGEQVTCDGRLVSLIGVGSDGGQATAIIQVDSTIYEASAGDRFAGRFLLRSIDGNCVTILYGDDAFRLCEGDRTLK